MADTKWSPNYPKRKLARVSYCERHHVESDLESSIYESDIDVDKPVAKKPRQLKPAPTKALPKKRIFPFMSLPPEIRNQIYDYALVVDEGIMLDSKLSSFRRGVKRITSEGFKAPGLAYKVLMLNRKIHEEALPVLYGRNEFSFVDTVALFNFLAGIGSRNLALLTELTVLGWGHGRGIHKAMNYPALTMLGGAVSLQRLSLRYTIGWRYDGVSHARQIYRDGFHFFEQFGAIKGRKDAGIDVLEYSPTQDTRYHYPVDDKSREEHDQNFAERLRTLVCRD